MRKWEKHIKDFFCRLIIFLIFILLDFYTHNYQITSYSIFNILKIKLLLQYIFIVD